MSKPRVSVVRCGSYECQQVASAVDRAISLLGGLEGFVRPGDRVFVKANHLSPPSPPERAIITHPKVVEAVLQQLLGVTSRVSFGDDVQADGDPFAVSGYRELAQRLGVPLVNLKQHGFTEINSGGAVLERVYIAREVLEADVVVNLPKLKTHSLTTLTGAVKNLYGVIPSGLRSSYHGLYSQPAAFNQALVDIYATAPPALHIMDAVVGMEGEGPAAGQPREVGLLLAGGDGVAVDAVAAHIMGLDSMEIGTTQVAHRRGVGVGELQEIELVGEAMDNVLPTSFTLPSTTPARYLGRVPPSVARLFSSQLTAYPTVVTDRCVGCRACAAICPVGAATMHGNKARIERRKCIRCMCCHEVCRYDAILLRRSLHGRALYRVMQAARRRLSSP
ncbi:MAG: DUF362 domain-containing protein [Candidatus Bipolaricaulota bacterium]